MKSALGLGKTLFNSSACVLTENTGAEIILTERLTRKKASGAWPAEALKTLQKRHNLSDFAISENRDVEDSLSVEQNLNKKFPFFEYLTANQLAMFSREFNKEIDFITHHLCHASAAAYMSPFEKALILVIDGAGSKLNLFSKQHPEFTLIDQTLNLEDSAEERSVYSLENGQLTCLRKNFQTFYRSRKHPHHYFSQGLGTFYEKVSEFIFNSKRSAGKVMGLAALGKPQNIVNSAEYLENLDWNQQYVGQTKKDWESSPFFEKYCQVAADMQNYFEDNYINYIKKLHSDYPEYKNLIIVGGCALNCTSNMKLYNLSLFENIYVSPFPGDESISLGAAHWTYLKNGGIWKPRPFDNQNAYFGSVDSIPNDNNIIAEFADFDISYFTEIEKHVAQLIFEGHVVGWYQGRSESGPRALGNRSILCRPDKLGMKNHLNSNIKYRESFRPYGSSVLFEKAHEYFYIPENFENPYMSFATKVKPNYANQLKEVTHYDGTSRMQTVRRTQNLKYYTLIEEFGQLSGLYCILNTSLNIMGEPIVENLIDAKNFLLNVNVHGMAIGNYYIRRR